MSANFDLKSIQDDSSALTHANTQNSHSNAESSRHSMAVNNAPYPISAHSDRCSPTKLPAITVFRGHHRKSSSVTSKGSSDRNRYLGHRRRRSVKFTADQDSKILSLRQQGLTWMEIAKAVGIESNASARNRHSVLLRQQEEELAPIEATTPPSASSVGSVTNMTSPLPSIRNFYGTPVIQRRPIKWNKADILCLKLLLEGGERAKWKFVANEVSRARGKRIPALACQKKFKEMYGVAEASSILGSSLSYVVFPNGWACLNDENSLLSEHKQDAHEIDHTPHETESQTPYKIS